MNAQIHDARCIVVCFGSLFPLSLSSFFERHFLARTKQFHCFYPFFTTHHVICDEQQSVMSNIKISIITIEHLDELNHQSQPILESLCGVANDVIANGSGIGWTKAMDDPLELMPYFLGQAKSQNIHLLVAHFENNQALGSLQLCDSIGKFRSDASCHRGELACFFVGTQYRGEGIGYKLLMRAEELGRELGLLKLTLDCRSTQLAAIKLYERCRYNRWGTMENYASLDGKVFHSGYFYDKDISIEANGAEDSNVKKA